MKRHPHLIAIAPCSYVMPSEPAQNLIEIQVTPAGRFLPSDGREMKVPGWYIDAEVAGRVIEKFNALKTDVVIDYEHQTLYKEQNGQPAPAAAWFRSLEWREGSGLWAWIEPTPRAKGHLASDEYRYFSPVFAYDSVTGAVLDLLMGALTNKPAIHGMEGIALQAAATFGFTFEPEDVSVKLLSAIIAALALKADATEEDAIAALTARLNTDPLADVRKTLSLEESADGAAVVAACSSLQAQAAKPDPAKFVPVEAVEQMRTQVAALTAQIKANGDKEVDQMIEDALDDGRLLKPLEKWARDLGEKDVAALTDYLGAAQPLSALHQSQTQGKHPVTDDKTGLTDAELAVCSAMGLKPEDYKATKES